MNNQRNPLTLGEAINVVRTHFERTFPKICGYCGRRFDSLQAFFLQTRARGSMVSFDADLGEWQPTEPLGILTYATCPCGNTLALGTDTMAQAKRLAILEWVRRECEERGVRPSVVLDDLRAVLRLKVLGESQEGAV